MEHCHRMLTETFGIDAGEVTYVENPWCGGGNAGAVVEVIVGGLELATLVFMDMEEHPEGDIELKGDMYRTMPLQIIDTGYGLERFAGLPLAHPPFTKPSIRNRCLAQRTSLVSTKRKSLAVPGSRRVVGVRCRS